ncbi:MAG: Phenylalanyl-tRNA synthetase subunit beta [Parcubacteria group bacterium Gr01-1014_48]|nr:MAG: Phenylalanyl-tRNA synthetase subunit beta [Parcubacteria group bacterium Greene0416_14]TSC73253.1 MAG: Phenylalanyl-tRNA synthetase subunit beta [Parcubacteria group bacterium Gr01-1014_48]TSD01130.1 MAG: Phenylalanyl-tRNA synthetase subunit beta [Parcubacteria group bacterium Greene1014_15]TSD08206.1 MAG: Phenylalanyl-tRNA synthetase subunit beta [Parcubacteria group bacterium Greene0714_4]
MMRISYNWLQSYFKEPLPKPKELADLLTMHSFEIEGLSEHDDDIIFEMKTLPNRAHDCLGHVGVAKDVALLLDRPLERNPLLMSTNMWSQSEKLDVHIESEKLCKRYSGLVLENVTVGSSPEWLQKRLAAIGQKSINNIVDAANFVMFDIGQPLHAFDMDKLESKESKVVIDVRTAKAGEIAKTLGGGEYKLSEDMLLITDGTADKPIGIAGIKGGTSAEITTKTKNILLESANFDPISVRKTAQALGLRTDASVRFEHELSPELTFPALVAAANLVLEIAAGDGVRVEGFVDAYKEPVELSAVRIMLEEICSLIGTDIPASVAEKILRTLSAGIEDDGDVYVVTPPFERLDITIKEDLIEEVGRMYGYEHVKPKKLPQVKNVFVNPKVLLSYRIRSILVELGFIEVYTYGFVHAGDIELENALAADKKFLRKDLAVGLSASLASNKLNAPLLGIDTVRIFEIGNVFTKVGEKWLLGIGIKNMTKKKEKETEQLRAVEKLFSEKLGTIVEGKLHDNVLEVDLDALSSRVSFDVGERLEVQREHLTTVYKKISPYPFIARDIALFVPEHTEPEDVLLVITAEAGELLVQKRLFDTYKTEDKISYAFSLVFQSEERTLADAEITPIMEKITTALQKKKGWKVR